jgi:AmmeMemoRadiSam system protein B/AmmeMemoRadiSam system protein A
MSKWLNERVGGRAGWSLPAPIWLVALMAGTVMLVAVLVTSDRAQAEKIHESVIAGSWYPGDATVLRRDVERYLTAVPEKDLPGSLVGLVAPHAGYQFSGQVAAHAYKLLQKQNFSTVVVIAPSHYASFPGVSVYDEGGLRTPLGVMPLDGDLVAALKKRDDRIRYFPEAYTREHSLEIQLPFLQVIQPGIKLVPLVMGDQDWGACERLAATVAECIRGKSVLVVASTDLSHFHSYDRAKSLDQVVLDHVSGLDPKGLHESLRSGRCEACGGGPLVTAMLVAQKLGASTGQVLHAANSGDVTGDRSRVVGYMAAALYTGPATRDTAQAAASLSSAASASNAKVGTDLGLSSEDKQRLHQIARQTINARLNGEKPPALGNFNGALKQPCGAFVTLKKRGELRGCIGHIVGARPLAETVAEMAEAAAFRDLRFPPVSASEFPELQIEISALTPLQRVSNPDEIRVGTHGIYLRRGTQGGLLLPQVATEQHWDRTTFLEQTCRKAGFPSDAWKDPGTEIYIFSADIF